jgi:ABC-2 type transport system ATP-binding protein
VTSSDLARGMARSGALHVARLSVAAGNRPLVSEISFAALPHEVTVVIGPNGAGKTSLLEGLVGIRSGSGDVSLGDRALDTFRSRAKTFAYLPDQSTLPPEVSVRALLDHAECQARELPQAEELARLLGLEPLLKQPLGVLSQGERKRLQLFCTLRLGRPVVVLDEPFSAFDPLQLRDVLQAVRLTAESGASVVVSLHQLADAERIADKLLLLAKGRAVAVGSIGELRALAGASARTLEEIFVTLLSRESRAA